MIEYAHTKVAKVMDNPAIAQLVDAFREATAVRLVALSADDAVQDCQRELAKHDGVCSMLLSNPATGPECHAFGCRQRPLLTTGKPPLILNCPFGMVRVAVPIHGDSNRHGSLVTEAVIVGDGSERGMRRARERLKAHLAREGDIDDVVDKTQFVSKARLESLVTLLDHLAANITDHIEQQRLRVHHDEPRQIRHVKEAVLSSGGAGLSTREAARLAGMSCQHFCRVFKCHTGMTFQAFVTRTRIDRAKHILLNQDLRITEVAFASGFESIPHFNRTFRRLTDCSPTEYRNRRLAISQES